jgi:PAS domain S-box-containing protein
MESKLAEQRERFDFATSAAQIGYWFCDLPFDKLIWDGRVKEHFWLPPDVDVDIDLFFARIHPDDREPTRAAIDASIGNRTRYDVEYRTVSPAGEQRWIRAIGRTAYSPDGTPLRFDGITQDVTQLKQAITELAESRERLRLFVENAPAAIVMFDREMRYMAVSRRWREESRLTGPVLGKCHYDLFPHLPGRWREAHRRGLAGEVVKSEQDEMTLPDGSRVWVRWQVHPWRTSEGDVGGILLTTENISEKVAAAEALDAERRHLKALYDNSPIGLLFADAEGRILSGNSQVERIVGHPVLFSKGLPEYDSWVAFHPDDRPVEAHEWPLARALARNTRAQGEYIYQRPDGRRVWVEITGAPIAGTDDRLVGVVVTITDIDARKRAEQALLQSEKLALVGRLAATISHEINNPLEAVTNLLYLIDASVTDTAAREYTRSAQAELARVAQIVTHTLRFYRKGHGSAQERISDLLESALAMYEARIRSSQVTLHKRYADDDRVRGNPSELRQVFANLIGNAFDASRAGGAVFLRTSRQHSRSTGAPGVRITVADNGAGMDAQTRKRLFEAFYTTKGDRGTGLGLWVSAEILARHQATVRVRSRQTPGSSGTVFSIWYPDTASGSPA